MMKWHMRKNHIQAMQRTLSLLLAALMLSSSVLAAGAGVIQLDTGLSILVENTAQKDKDDTAKQYEAYMKATYGSDWEKVAALQPGDSYISGDTLYICSEETYVDWERVYSKEDLDPSGWGGEDRLLFMTNELGSFYTGNDFANTCKEIDGTEDQMALKFDDPSRTRKVASGVTRDTTDSSTVEYTEEYIYPELHEFDSKAIGYGYPDTFRTLGTMNAPYIRDAGLDVDNGNHQKFKIILSKDDGTPSGVALSYRITYEGAFDYGWSLDLKAVNECTGHTFYMENGKLSIFENIEGEDDLRIRTSGLYLYGVRYGGELKDIPSSDLIIYIGKKTVGKTIETISLSLDDAEQNPEALENVYGGAIEFYHWEKITSGSQLPTEQGVVYRALLVWEDKYFLQGDDFRKKSGDDSMALYVNEEKSASAAPGNVVEVPQIDLSQDEFYTMGGLGTPYLRFNFKDTDSDNDYCPYYSFQLAGMDDQPSGMWLCDGDNILDVCLDAGGDGRYGGLDVGIIVGVEGDDDNDAAPGKVKLFLNENSGYDTRFVYSGNMLYGDDCGWGGSGQFTLYIGKPVVYPAVRQNYVVGEDQFMHISQNGAMFKNVTITVAPGGVLSIESWFMNNGRIIVDGGTLIVQEASNPLGDEMTDDTEDSVMMPFADIHPLISGSLELRNGAELIIMDNARAAFSNIKATTGSSILNCGILMAETIDLHSSTVENRENAAILAGYDFRDMPGFRVSDLIADKNGAKMPQMVSRLQNNVSCITRRMYSSIHNDGWITYSTVRSSVRHDSVKESGSGVYTKLQGDKSRYTLSS